VIEDAEQKLSPRLRWLLERLWQEWKQMEIDIQAITDEIERISNGRKISSSSCPAWAPMDILRTEPHADRRILANFIRGLRSMRP
jgi:hypothetical protein